MQTIPLLIALMSMETTFSDFFEWFKFIGNISNMTNHEWYLKTHPYIHKKGNFTTDVINKIIKAYPKIKLIESNISHNQLAKEGINCVLTVLGGVVLNMLI